jgi:hypothetical protein
MKPYFRPIYDPVFKHLMHFEDLRNDFIGSIINEKISSSIILDVALNPLPMYRELRELVNQSKIETLMNKFADIDESLLQVDTTDNEIRSMLMGAIDFVKSLAPKYYQLTQAVPDAERNTQLDIVCKTDNELINIDIQLMPQNYWDLRILDHVCGLFHKQFGRGFKWSELETGFIDKEFRIRRSIGISILDKPPTHPENVTRILPWYNAKPWAYNELKRVYKLREDNDHDAIRPGIIFYDFNLQAFNALRKEHGFGDCSESLVGWIDFLSAANKKTREEVAQVKSKILQKAYNIIDDLPMDIEAKAEEFLKRQENISHYVSERIAEARKDGVEEGKVEGKIEGKIEIARNMLEKGIDISMIAECTELSVEELKNIEESKKDIL